MSRAPLRHQLAHHRRHLAGCALAVVFVFVATAFDLPLLAALGALLCGAMMLSMVWMMARHGGHHHH